MQFQIRRMLIPPRPKGMWQLLVSAAGALLVGFICLVLLPFMLGCLLVLLMYMGGSWIWGKINRSSLHQELPEDKHLEQAEEAEVLFRNEYVQLITHEIDWDAKENSAFLEWASEMFGPLGEYPEYQVWRLATVPEIPGLHGQLVIPLCQEWESGVFLQVVMPTRPTTERIGTSWLVYLDYKTWQWRRVEEVGECRLFISQDNPHQFEGLLPDGSRLWLRVDAVA